MIPEINALCEGLTEYTQFNQWRSQDPLLIMRAASALETLSAEGATLRAENAALRAECERMREVLCNVQHGHVCPAQVGWLDAGPCTCGLDAAIAQHKKEKG